MYCAEVAELADARGSGPRTRKGVGVRVPSSAPEFCLFRIKSRSKSSSSSLRKADAAPSYRLSKYNPSQNMSSAAPPTTIMQTRVQSMPFGERLCISEAIYTITRATPRIKGKRYSATMKSGLKFLEVAGVEGHTEVIAPGSWSDLPQVAQSHAAGSTSQPHSAQYIGGRLEGWIGDNAIGITRLE